MCLWINVPELGIRMNFRRICHPRESKMLNRCLDDVVKIADKDIHYYKMLTPLSHLIDGKPVYRTPYRCMVIELDKEIKSNKPIKVDTYRYLSNTICISYGIHMFTNLTYATERSLLSGCIVFDCIIPKGTRYVLGGGYQAVAEKVIIRKMNE